ncbi:MAG: riboflavin synthase [Pirellulaceae bacterium]
MFSGLIEAKAQIVALQPEPGGIRLQLTTPANFDDVSLGDSIAVQGCCLTVVDMSDGLLSFQAGRETLAKTSLGARLAGDAVNVERSLALGDRLGGHLVTGHVDGPGELISRIDEAQWSTMTFHAPPDLMRQMASKGSITVDGVSLTLVDVTDKSFSVALIPHTLQHTTLGDLRPGDRVNLETDLLAKYVERQLTAGLRLEA